MTYHILFNPLAGNGKGEERAKRLETLLTDGARCYHDLTKLNGYAPLLRTLEPQDVLVLTGGDGTINRFLNEADYDAFENEILYYATGSGNDFLHDLDKPADAAPFSLRPYLKNLPSVTVNGQTRRFLNGIGYGIDGYCCEVGDRLRGTTDKPVNYTAIAIKGLLSSRARDGHGGRADAHLPPCLACPDDARPVLWRRHDGHVGSAAQ